ncbi:Aste57867_1878 [Aphanomyces stellatus]|uniref:Aste57867_1878 protein n=1 Tax=Aphanomyces stellatus TaxID=120398 RepID=A0A485K9S4_9STRA|nr:hypothetical protein As57867_001876 [Aphanomyces stellatus]VFT79085.1 Aste57867_1878 [Aphanomyces stellatus]
MEPKADATEQRKLRDRLRKQRYQLNHAEESKRLRDEIALLWRRYDKIQRATEQKSMNMLPWETVSDALKEAAVESALRNASLKRHVSYKKKLIHELEGWIARCSQPTPALPDACKETWRNTSLPLNAESRRLGMKWIVEHMYHQSERMLFQERFFDRGTDVSVTFHDGGIAEVDVHCDAILPCSVARAAGILWKEMYVRPAQDEVDLCYKQARAVPTPDGTHVLMNALFGRFDSPERTVIVSRAIVDDELRPWHAHEYNYKLLYWIVLEPLSPQETRWRAFSRMHHPFNPLHGYMSLDAYARLRGLDTSLPSYTKDLRDFLVDKRRVALGKFQDAVTAVAMRRDVENF